ncbi:MAG: cation diffusion facilitator family transporter [Thermodesulfobacteriota bacterium]|nr:cation diffusion facilitator family transporter [Thermodesulfobacteriota bacterium]
MSEKRGEARFLERKHLRMRLLAISLSFLVGLSLMAVKFYAYRLTQSSAILSDALESIINVVASAFALGSILLAAKPPDESHPYGHGKIEYFSAGFEGALIVLAALGIFKTGIGHILHPHPLPLLEMGLIILLGAGLINLLLGMGLIRVGKKTHSLALIADGKHVLTDVYTSAGVLVGLFLVRQTGWYWLDGAIACLVGLNILVTGAKLVRQSFSALMHASDPDLLKEIATLLVKHRKDVWIDIHQLRAWRSGSFVYIDFHLVLPRDYSLEEAHGEVKELEKVIADHFGGAASLLIHTDPCVDPDCPICRRHVCGLRQKDHKAEVPWKWQTLIQQGGAGERLEGLAEE